MFNIFWITTVIISYFFYRYNFIHMDRIAKETAPIVFVIILMLIPVINLICGLIIYLSFVNNYEIDGEKLINKIFNIKP